MAQSTERILIIGGGFSGRSAAIELRKSGHAVDLVEIDPGWRSCGAGISLGGATLRAFQARRWERCRMVVENSMRLGEIEIAGGDKEEHARIMRESLMALAQAI